MENLHRSEKNIKSKAGIDIDIRKMDQQLERHLNKVLMLTKTESCDDDKKSKTKVLLAKEKWEIDPNKLLLKRKFGQGTFGSVHRGLYDGLDVAGNERMHAYI